MSYTRTPTAVAVAILFSLTIIPWYLVVMKTLRCQYCYAPPTKLATVFDEECMLLSSQVYIWHTNNK